MRWRILAPDAVSEHWAWVEPLLAKSLKRYGDDFDVSDFYEYVQDERVQVWALDNRSAVITDIQVYPKKKYARILIGMGNVNDTTSFLCEFEQWAKAQGCSRMQSQVRKGFTSNFKQEGWKVHNLMEKDI